MKVRIFSSSHEVLFLALEEILWKLKNDYMFNDFDFIIFAVSDKYYSVDINNAIKKIFGTNNYIAFNAINSFCNDMIVEGVSALFIKFERKGKLSVYKVKHLKEINSSNLNIVILPYEEDSCQCKKIKDSNIVSIGGVASGEKETYVYYADEIIKHEIVVLEFENVDYELGISLGYQPIGPTYKVQVAKDNKLYVINYEDASLLAKKLLKDLNNDIKNLWFSPVLVVSDKTGYVEVVRTFKNMKDGEYVEFFGNLESSELIKLSFATEQMLLKSDEETAKKIKKKMPFIDLAFNFSCVARQYILGTRQQEESLIYSRIFNAPLFGFFTFGEIGPNADGTSTKLYNQSSLVVALKEK
jgi:hypothetical protein